MLPTGSHVFLDANVIIEAHRAAVWNAIRGTFRLDTVTRCIEELNTGRRRPVPVDTEALSLALCPKQPTQKDFTVLRLKYPGSVDMDPGEKDLVAFVLSLPENTYFVCSPDKAMIRAAYVLKIIDRYVTLEDLTETAGVRADLRSQYLKAFLARERTKLLLELP